MYNDPVTTDDLIKVYLRFKEWMDYDHERSPYCAMEVKVFQELFGTAYVVVPRALTNATYADMQEAMHERLALIDEMHDAIYNPAEDGKFERVLQEMDKTTFRSTVHYFQTLHEAITQMTDSVVVDESGELQSIDDEPMEDYLDQSDALFDEVHDFILSEHPELKTVSFPLERVYALGLPRNPPLPIDHGPPGLDS